MAERKPTRDELLAKVTGKGRNLPPVPPAAAPAPGFKGQLPLPQGVPTAPARVTRTPAELAALRQAGFQDGDPIPEGMADIFAEAQQEAAHIRPNVEIEIDPQQVSRVRDRARQALEEEKLASAQARAEASRQGMPDSVRAAAAFAANLEVEDDRPAAPAAASAANPTTPADQTGAGGDHGLTYCPHCLWDLRRPDVPEPPWADKMAFLQAILGDKPFIKELAIFGGQVTIALRTLTMDEIDAIAAYVYGERVAGRLPTEMDYYEHLQRYRLFLQLVHVRTDQGLVALPDGLSEETNPSAAALWTTKLQVAATAPLNDPAVLLPKIRDYVTKRHLRHEMLFRAVNMQCAAFNRLVAKMEGMVDNSDFWKPTEPQP